MRDGIIFDSFLHTRKIYTEMYLMQNGRVIETIKLDVDRLVVRETAWYNRMELHFLETTPAATFCEFGNQFIKEHNQSPSTYISISAFPNGRQDTANKVAFFISFTAISQMSRDETEKDAIIFLCQADNEYVAFINNEQILNGRFHELTKKTTELTDEEIQFASHIIQSQEEPNYFPTAKDFLENKKRAEKEKKKQQQKQNGLFGSSKKKKQEASQTVEAGEGQFINPKSLKIHKGSESPERELQNITGLNNIKSDIDKMQSMLEYEKSRKERGIETSSGASMHMCFLGNPGTGKTTIARIMTGILYNMKVIKKNQCIEVSGLDLKGGYVGQTGIITKAIVDMARGGILFIDEAYSLCEDRGNDFGKEAISVLLKEMEDNRGDLVVIFAGYEDDMNKFLNVNPGFRSRINKYFDFLDYTTLELSNIFVRLLRKMHLKIDEPALTKCMKLFTEAKKYPNFSNGRFVRNLAEQIEEEHILNTIGASDERLDSITLDDVTDKLVSRMLGGM